MKQEFINKKYESVNGRYDIERKIEESHKCRLTPMPPPLNSSRAAADFC
jgi:hypothetical protein